MNKKLLLATLIITTSAFGAQKSSPNQAPTNNALPIDLQVKLAELKLDKINVQIAKGPETNYKDLIVPTLGMGAGIFGILYSGSGVISTKKIADTHGASLLVSSVIFLISYVKFNTTDTQETRYLSEKKIAQQQVVNYLRRQQESVQSRG